MRPTVILLLPLIAACSDMLEPGPEAHGEETLRWADLGRSCPADAPATLISPAARALLPEPNIEGHYDATMAALALLVPGGWGGFFYEDGVPTMYMVDSSRTDEAAELLRTEGVPIPPSVISRQGRWDFAQMYDWYRHLNDSTQVVEGVSSSDIQEARNRIEYGVVDEDVRGQLEAVLGELEIPCYLVAIEIQPYLVLGG